MMDVPEFMKEDTKAHTRQSMRDNPGLWIAAARFAATKGFDSTEALALIMQAYEVRRAQNLPHWKQEVAAFEESPLRRGGRTRGENYDRPVIGFFLQQAMLRLIELSYRSPSSTQKKANCSQSSRSRRTRKPPTLSQELSRFLQPGLPRDAHKRAKLQAILIRRPDLTTDQLADKAKCNRSLAYRYLSDGTIRRLP